MENLQRYVIGHEICKVDDFPLPFSSPKQRLVNCYLSSDTAFRIHFTPLHLKLEFFAFNISSDPVRVKPAVPNFEMHACYFSVVALTLIAPTRAFTLWQLPQFFHWKWPDCYMLTKTWKTTFRDYQRYVLQLFENLQDLYRSQHLIQKLKTGAWAKLAYEYSQL